MVDPKRLVRLQKSVRTGGPGSMRRKRKVKPRNNNNDEKKLQAVLRRQNVSTLGSQFDEINFFGEDSKVMAFTNPSLSANPNSNTFVVQGKYQLKDESEINNLSNLMSKLTPEQMQQFAELNKKQQAGEDLGLPNMEGDFETVANDDEVPELVEDEEEKTEDKE